MVVSTVIITIIILACLMPRKFMKQYFIVSAILLGSLYFFAEPTTDADLYRYYALLSAIRNVPWRDILTMRAGSYGNYILNSYIPSYPVFCVYTKIMSYFPQEFYVVVETCMIYLFPITYTFSEETRGRKWTYVLGYSYYLMCFNFLSTSGIRNIFCAMAFCFALYHEFVLGKSKVVCWSCYIGVCFIHSYGVLLLGIRCLLLITNKYTKLAVCGGVMLGYFLLTSRNTALFDWLPGGSFIRFALQRLISYVEYTGTTSDKRRYFILFVYLCFLLLLYLCNKYCKFPDKFKKLYDFLILAILFSLGAYNQYDTFVRGTFIVYPLSGILFRQFLSEYGGKRFYSVRASGESDGTTKLLIFSGFVFGMLLIFCFQIAVNYLWMDQWFF